MADPGSFDRGLDAVTLPGHLLNNARERGDRVAFHVLEPGDTTTTFTWADLAQASAWYADLFRDAGVTPGSVVVICLRHSPSLYPAYLGAMLAGAIPSFIPFPTPKQDPALYWEAHRVLFSRVQAAVVLTYADLVKEISEVLPSSTRLLVDRGWDTTAHVDPDSFTLPGPDATALLQHSSGTTGHKKGVMLTHRQVSKQIAPWSSGIGFDSDGRIASWLPLYHDMGLIAAFIGPLVTGGSVVAMDPFAWVEEPHMLLRAMDEYDCHYTWLPNFAFNHLVRTKQGNETYRLDGVRAFVNCSEPTKPETFDLFLKTFASHGVRAEQLTVSYGMAEAVFCVAQTSPGRTPVIRTIDGIPRLSTGPVLEGIEVRVDPAAEGGSGEFQVRGGWLSDGYYKNPEATAEVFHDGWYSTGDLGCILDGEVFVFGRKKDVIIHHGVNYYAHDLEAAALSVPGLKAGRCVAVPVYDEAAGSESAELIAEREGDPADDARLAAAVKQAVSDRFNLALGNVHLVEPGWLVKTTSGKISRTENLAKLVNSAAAQPHPAAADAADGLLGTVVALVASTFDVPAADLGPDTVAADVRGWDSLGHTVLMIRLGKALGQPVPESVASRARSVGHLVELLSAREGGHR